MQRSSGEGGGVNALITTIQKADPAKEQLASLALALAEFVKLNPHMPVSQIVAFILVAIDSNMSVQDIQENVCVKKSTASKHLMELGVSRLEGDGNYGLITRGVNPQYAREARFYLTEKGTKMAKALIRALGRLTTE